jgi:hypothetical protein
VSRAEAKSTSGWDACEAADADRATRDTIAATFTPTPRLVARLLEARGPVEKFDVLLRAGWWSAWDTALAAARVEREDPSAYAGRRAIRRSMRDRVYRDAIAAIADRRPHEFGHRYDLLLSQGIDLNHVIHYHKSQRLPVAGAAPTRCRAIIEATGGIPCLTPPTGFAAPTEATPIRAVVGALVALYGQGRSPSTPRSSADPGVFVIRAGRWHLDRANSGLRASVARSGPSANGGRGTSTSVVPSSEIDASQGARRRPTWSMG